VVVGAPVSLVGFGLFGITVTDSEIVMGIAYEFGGQFLLLLKSLNDASRENLPPRLRNDTIRERDQEVCATVSSNSSNARF